MSLSASDPHLTELLTKMEKERFVYPDYDGLCLSLIPDLFLSFFDIKKIPEAFRQEYIKGASCTQKVLFFIDGLGYTQLSRYLPDCPWFARLVETNNLRPITTVFPSTTAAAMSTMHTGLTPQEHGLFEWRIYFPAIDDVAMTLPFTRQEKDGNDSLAKEGVSGQELLRVPTIYEALHKRRIPSYVFKPKEFARSAYSQVAHRGATTITYITITDMLANLVAKLERAETPGYYLVYWSGLDGIAHTYGPHSPQYQAELRTISYLLQKEFADRLSPKTKKDTLFALTADHGQLTTDLRQASYLSENPEIIRCLGKRKNGDVLYPWGSPRDVFLRADSGKKEELMKHLKAFLGNRAVIWDTQSMMKQGFFGRGQPHPEWNERLGDIAILSTENYISWYESPRTERVFKLGQHGGLDRDEMIIPFACAPLSTI